MAKQTSKPTSPGLICSDTPFSTRSDGRAGYEKSAQADGCKVTHTCADGQSNASGALHAPTFCSSTRPLNSLGASVPGAGILGTRLIISTTLSAAPTAALNDENTSPRFCRSGHERIREHL